MKRPVRAMGIVLVLLLAMGAAAAQAAEFHAEEEGKTALTGQKPEKATFGFHWNDGTPFCTNATFSGSLAAKTSSTATLFLEIPKSECINTLSMGACHFVVHASGKFEIAGSACAEKPIEYNLPLSWCKVLMGPQSRPSGISYENKGVGAGREIIVDFNVAGLHYTQTGAMCGGGVGTFTNGGITGPVTLSADKLGGGQQGLWIE